MSTQYTEQTWIDGTNGTPYTAIRQTHQEQGITGAHNRLDALTTGLPIGTTAGTVAAGNDSRFAAVISDPVVRTALFGGAARTYAPVAAWRLSQNGLWNAGDGGIAANVSEIVDPDASLHIGSAAANDYTSYTCTIPGRYALFLRAVWGVSTAFTEAHVLKNGTQVGAHSISTSEGGSGFFANLLYDEVVLAATDVLRWFLYSSTGNTLMANRLGGVTTTASVRWLGPI